MHVALKLEPRLVATEDTMNSRLILTALVLGLVLVSGCAKVNEPWDNTGYFKDERARSAAQQQALQHRLAYFREGESDQPWTHSQH